MTRSPIAADGVIGLRSAVLHEQGWSVLPAMAVHHQIKAKKLFKVQLPTYMKDDVSLWWLRARKDMNEKAKVVAKWIGDFQID
jgi:DNA-binding transcriptional LysR family regulator